MKRLLIQCMVFICMISSVSNTTSEVIDDANWTTFGQSGAFNWNNYYEIVSAKDFSGNFYIATADLVLGGMYIHSIAKWDHQKWTEIAPGVSGRQISSMVIDSMGNLYVAAKSSAESESSGLYCVLKWDGTVWHKLGNDLHGIVRALAIDSKRHIFAGTEHFIAKLDSMEWKIIGEMQPDKITDVRSIAFDQHGNTYVCGYFDTISGIRAGCIAKWDGSKWGSLSDKFPKYDFSDTSSISSIDDMIFFKNELYINGDFRYMGTDSIYNVAKWDGNAWRSVMKNNSEKLGGLLIDKQGTYYGIGYSTSENPLYDTTFTFAKLIDNEWVVIGSSNLVAQEIMMDNASNIYAMRGGDFMQLDQGEWSIVCSEFGIDGIVDAFAIDPSTGDLYIGGSFSAAGNKKTKNIARWDGTSWNAVGTGVNFFVHSLAVGKDGILFAGGEYYPFEKEPILSAWNGTSWNCLLHQMESNLDEVDAIAVDSSGNLFVGGRFDRIGGVPTRNIAKWDGVKWGTLNEGITGWIVQALEFDKNGNLYAGGVFDKAGTLVAHNVAKWDGTEWSCLGDGIQRDPDSYPAVTSLVIDNKGVLYAGGKFGIAGGVEARNIAKWNGISWSSLGSGIHITDTLNNSDCRVNALSTDANGNIYAGGYFNLAGSTRTHGIAQWDGAKWNAMGSGVGKWNNTDNSDSLLENGNVSALITNNKEILSVGGWFTTVAGKTSACFAQCNLMGPSPVVSSRLTNKAGNSILKVSNDLVKVRCNYTTKVRYSIYSLSGRQINHGSELMTAGEHSLRLKTTSLVKGAYIADVRAGDASLRYLFVER
jgi:hypothetical protein